MPCTRCSIERKQRRRFSREFKIEAVRQPELEPLQVASGHLEDGKEFQPTLSPETLLLQRQNSDAKTQSGKD